MHSNPNLLYQMLYGGISKGNIRTEHEARSNMLDQIEKMAAAKGQSLPVADKQRYGQYIQGFKAARSRPARGIDFWAEFSPEGWL